MTVARHDRCERHRRHATRESAEQELSRLALRKLTKGDSWKFLKVFQCGDHFHIGRDWEEKLKG